VAYQIGSKSAYKWRRSAICLQRGRFNIGPWRLRTGDPFGLFEVIIDYAQTDEMIIDPPLDAEINFSLPTGLQQGDVVGRDRALQVTSNISGVRSYQPMDPLNWIHWPSTARTGALAVREFDVEAAGDAWILIDVEAQWQAGKGLESTEEYAVLLASTLATRVLAQNRAVGLATYGTEPVVLPSQKGTQQHWRLLSTLAESTADGDTRLPQALDDIQESMARGSALILITPNLSDAWLSKLVQLSRKQIKTTIILLDRPTFTAEAEADSPIWNLEQTIKQMGYAVEVIQKGDINLPAVPSDGPDIFKVSPLGRAQRVTD